MNESTNHYVLGTCMSGTLKGLIRTFVCSVLTILALSASMTPRWGPGRRAILADVSALRVRPG